VFFSFLWILEGKLLSFFERVKKLETPVSRFGIINLPDDYILSALLKPPPRITGIGEIVFAAFRQWSSVFSSVRILNPLAIY
jgi:hypothetical protein